MKMYVPAGLAKYVHVYTPTSYSVGEGRETFEIHIDAGYMNGFPELDQYFAKTPHFEGKSLIKISSRKRPEVITNNIDLLMYELDCRKARNVSGDNIFLDRDIIVEFEIKEITPNMAGYKGYFFALKSVEVNF